MRPATSCEFPARKLRRSMSSRTPMKSPFAVTATRRLLCLVILRSAVETRSSCSTQTTGRCASGADRAFDRPTVEDRSVQEVGARDDAHPLAANEQGIGLVSPHERPGLGDRGVRLDELRRVQEEIFDPRAEQGREARALLLARNRIELVGDVEIEERSEARVLVDELQGDVARKKIAERLLARDEDVRAAPLDQRAAVERIARPSQRDEVVAVALFDHALDDDVEAVGRAVAGDDRLVRVEIGDVQRTADDFDLVVAQPVERRVPRVEMLRHRFSPPGEALPPGPGAWQEGRSSRGRRRSPLPHRASNDARRSTGYAGEGGGRRPPGEGKRRDSIRNHPAWPTQRADPVAVRLSSRSNGRAKKN